MPKKRSYKEIYSDSFDSVIKSNNNEPLPKRRKTNLNEIVQFPLKFNINISNHNKQQNNEFNDDESTNNPNIRNRNLRRNRITTETQPPGLNHKNNEEYKQSKHRILTETPSPMTSPENTPSPPSLDRNTLYKTDTNHQNILFTAKQSTKHDIKKRLRFDINNGEQSNNDRKVQFNISPQPIGQTNGSKTIISETKHRFDQAFRSSETLNKQSCTHRYNGWLKRRKAFRNYVLNDLNDNRECIQKMCVVFVMLCVIWSAFNIFCFHYYGTMDILLCTVIALMVLTDLSHCNGDGALCLMIMITFLIELLIEFMMRIWIYIEFSDEQYGLKLMNDLVIYGLLLMIIFVFDEYYLCDTVIEWIFNRGKERRMISYLMYFWFNGYMICDLISCLYGIKEENHSDFGYLWSSYINMSVICGYIGIVIGLWFKLQDTQFIEIKQCKLNEICGFLVIIIANYCMFFGGYHNIETKRCVVGKSYVLLVLITVLLLHKLFYL